MAGPFGYGRLSVGAVVVAHNSAHCLPALLSRLRASPDVEVCVVDNSSRDPSVEVASQMGVSVLRMGRNSGYASACNAGARWLAESHDWYAFLNPDVLITAADLVTCAAEAPDDTGCVVPLLIGADGTPVPDLARPLPRASSVTVGYLLSSRADLRTRSIQRRFMQSQSRHFSVPATTGACLLIRKPLFEAMGGFRQAYFFAGEDLDLCYRVGQEGWRIVIDRGVAAEHNKGSSTSGVADAAKMLECARAQVQFFEFNGSVRQTLLTALSVGVGTLIRCEARPGDMFAGLSRRLVYRTLIGELSAMVVRSWRKMPRTAAARPLFLPE